MNTLYREAFVFECAEKNHPFFIPGDGQQPLQFFDIADMCRFMEILLEQRSTQRIFNVGNPEPVTIRDWVTQCYHAAGKEPEFRSVDASVPQRDYFPFYDYAYQLDVSDMLGLMSTVKPMKAGLRESYAWYQENREQIKRKPLMDFIDEHLV